MSEENTVAKIARERFGVPYLYPFQILAIANALDGMNAGGEPAVGEGKDSDGTTREEIQSEEPRGQIVILPTGYGKSLCFQLPALVAGGLTVVVYPLVGLIADQIRGMRARGIACSALQGGMDPDRRAEALSPLRPGESRILLTTPETLSVPATNAALRALEPVHVVVDEAHCVAEWGDSFREAYRGLGDAAAALGPRFLSAFTATASPPVLARMAELLFGSSPYRLVAGIPDRPNIH